MTETTEASTPNWAGDGGYCYGCEQSTGRRVHHDAVFTDSRTGRSFCHECIECLVSWEMDGRPEPDESSYPEWLGERAAEVKGQWVKDAKGFWTYVGGPDADRQRGG